MIYLLLKTLITVATVVIVSEIAKRSSLFAAIIVSIPLTSFLAFIWLYFETKDSQKVIDLSFNIILMVIPSFVFFIILPWALKLQLSFIFAMILSTFVRLGLNQLQ